MSDLAVVMPVLNDWASAAAVVKALAAEDLGGGHVHAVLVDDGSTETPDPADFAGTYIQVHVVRLRANQGHQRAIALGLAHVRRSLDVEHVLVMDADGEDRPDAAPRLLAEARANPGEIVVARRGRRSEGPIFRVFYQVYKWLFALMTDRAINFGNFSVIPADRLDMVLFNVGIWNNFAATMLRSRAPIRFCDVDRGSRYHGESRMNFTSLVVHGLGAVAVFSDLVVGRMIILLAGFLALIGASALGVAVLRFTTDIFIPGYATTVVLFLASIGLNALLLGFVTMVLLLNGRSAPFVVPEAVFEQLVERVERLA
jgi:glycosyltransferase involved in cell wall biosynthesis